MATGIQVKPERDLCGGEAGLVVGETGAVRSSFRCVIGGAERVEAPTFKPAALQHRHQATNDRCEQAGLGPRAGGRPTRCHDIHCDGLKGLERDPETRGGLKNIFRGSF